MEHKIKKEVYSGSGAAHLLSIKVKETELQEIKKSRKSALLETNHHTLNSFFKLPL